MRAELYFPESKKQEIIKLLLAKCHAGEIHAIWNHRVGVKIRVHLWDEPVLLTWFRAGQLVGIGPSRRFYHAQLSAQLERRREYLRDVGRTEPIAGRIT